jgi:hypothetical protein
LPCDTIEVVRRRAQESLITPDDVELHFIWKIAQNLANRQDPENHFDEKTYNTTVYSEILQRINDTLFIHKIEKKRQKQEAAREQQMELQAQEVSQETVETVTQPSSRTSCELQ